MNTGVAGEKVIQYVIICLAISPSNESEQPGSLLEVHPLGGVPSLLSFRDAPEQGAVVL